MLESSGEGSERRAQILGAAFEEFSEKGFQGATIKSIARAAGLNSPALIYWYFPDKESLFREVLDSRAPLLRNVRDTPASLDRPPEEVLPEIARAYFETVKSPLGGRLARLMIGEAMRRPAVAEMVGKATVVRVLGFLNRYLSRQVELGRLRPHDTRSGARAFMGMLIPQAAGNVLFPALRTDGLEDDEHIETAVGIFLRGLAPEGKEE